MSNIFNTIKLFRRTGCIALLSVFVLTISSACLAAVDNEALSLLLPTIPTLIPL